MIVLHGWWSDDQLVLWAEDSEEPAEPPRRPGRRPKVQDHPYALEPELLAKLLEVGSGWTGVAELALPSRGHGPQPSPELLRGEAPPGEVRGWRVPTLALDADGALDLLLQEEPDATTSNGWVPGGDVRQLAALAAFADSLAERGRVLPAVRQGERGGEAVWLPVVTGPDAQWLRAAAGTSPESTAESVDALTDAAVRRRVGLALRPGRRTWIDALRGTTRTFPATERQVTDLAAALAQWQSQAGGTGPVRACFRLTEPDEDEAVWSLVLGLQASDEPSLVVDAEQVWRGGPDVAALAPHVDDPQEALLAELGRAVRLFPGLTAALRTATPTALELDTAGAHEFLAETAPLLVASGYGVLLPAWWGRPQARLGARLRASTPGQPGATDVGTVIGQQGLADVRWEVLLGEHGLDEDELAALAAAGQRLVRVRGQWVQVDPDKLARARTFLRRRRSGPMALAEVLQALARADDGPGGLPVVDVQADGWLADLLSGQAEHRVAAVAAPDGFGGTLRPYQERGLAWLAFLEQVGVGGVLADDMGLGKTVQLLALVARSPGDGPTLLVCPMSLVGNWQREAARFTPDLRVHVHHGADRARGEAFDAAVASCDLFVTTYALLARDAAALAEVRWHRLVLDEAQAVKNAATRAAVAARTMQTPRRLAVTGTPVENRLADLWALLDLVNPGLLGSANEFRTRFAAPIEKRGDPDARDRLRALTQPFVLRRLKTDTSIISDLPAKLEMDVVCSLTREQASLYAAVVDQMLERIATTEGIERRGLILSTMTKLKQICNAPAQYLRDGSRVGDRSGKLERLEETLEEVLAAGEKALLFTQYAEFGAMLREHLTARFGREVLFLHGGVKKADRDAMVERFQGAGGPPLFVLSLKAGGTGLTLTAASHVVHVDRWWNPAVEDQATDRAYRIGQTRQVQVRKLVCAGTLEEKIAASIRDKRGLAASVVGDGEGWLTELSTSALRELFTLDAGAVVE
ncbi:MAG TPA: DEAD/DEAH box helicase [Mycobacteriales bacterium]|nr:DEAD/DEAH box helicase [Mycobacteriales bacterium]